MIGYRRTGSNIDMSMAVGRTACAARWCVLAVVLFALAVAMFMNCSACASASGRAGLRPTGAEVWCTTLEAGEIRGSICMPNKGRCNIVRLESIRHGPKGGVSYVSECWQGRLEEQ